MRVATRCHSLPSAAVQLSKPNASCHARVTGCVTSGRARAAITCRCTLLEAASGLGRRLPRKLAPCGFHLAAPVMPLAHSKLFRLPQERLWRDVFAATTLHQRSPSGEALPRLSYMFQHVLSSSLDALFLPNVSGNEGFLEVPLLCGYHQPLLQTASRLVQIKRPGKLQNHLAVATAGAAAAKACTHACPGKLQHHPFSESLIAAL